MMSEDRVCSGKRAQKDEASSGADGHWNRHKRAEQPCPGSVRTRRGAADVTVPWSAASGPADRVSISSNRNQSVQHLLQEF